MNRHMQQIDHQTGEVVEGFVAYVVPKRKRISERMDGNGSRSNDACSKQFNRQRHEGYVGNAWLDYENLIQVKSGRSIRTSRHEPP